ncbi:MAG: hypothetical protein R3342_02325 [Lutibacter sp.]|uniref:hypothetical protein n=1 Tax=Lutibacter sp. TaxID=1925666 RepID=UPI00299EE006|nr:hypothetical protein [Lutibacter sp.]MDX1828361.1 hypothetical protein [Lutibacter sp.]
MKFKLLYLTIVASFSLNFFILKPDSHKVELDSVFHQNTKITQTENITLPLKTPVHKKYLEKNGTILPTK